MRRILLLCLCVLARAICDEDDDHNITTTSAPSPKIKRDYSFDTIVQLPEIIINRAVNPGPTGGYHYPIPDFPAQFDEPTSPPFIYGPPQRPTNPPLFDPITPIPPTFIPIAYPPLGNPPGPDLLPPQHDPIPTDDTVVIPLPPVANDPYLPPAPTTAAGGFAQARTPINPVQMRVFNMSCMDGATSRYFRTTMRTSHFLENAPIVEDATASDCIFGNGDTFKIDLDASKMTKCGVKYCSNNNQVNLCMSLRIPSVRFLRLPEDALVTLQCKVQDKIVSHTKHLRINPQFL